MVRRLNESIIDKFGIVIDDGKEAWIICCDSKQVVKKLKKYLDTDLDDITYTLKTASDVCDYLQKFCLDKLGTFMDVDYCDIDDGENMDEYGRFSIGPVLYSVEDWYDI